MTFARCRNCWVKKDVPTTQIYTRVLNRGGRGVLSPLNLHGINSGDGYTCCVPPESAGCKRRAGLPRPTVGLFHAAGEVRATSA